MNYAEWIWAQSNNILWAEKIERGEQLELSQTNVLLEHNMSSNTAYTSYSDNDNNMLSTPDLELSIILYQAN